MTGTPPEVRGGQREGPTGAKITPTYGIGRSAIAASASRSYFFWKIGVLSALIVIAALVVRLSHVPLSEDMLQVQDSHSVAGQSLKVIWSQVRAGSPGEVCGALLSGVALCLALWFTIGFAFVQYVRPAIKQGNTMRAGTASVVFGMSFVLFALSLDLIFGKAFPTLSSWEFLALAFPSWKNIVVCLVAAVFWFIDLREPLFNSAVVSDRAVFFSILLSSVLLGLVGEELVGAAYVHAYNTGAVSFHLIIGTILFEPAN